MNDERLSESWRRVRVSPSLPSSTSSWATSPRSRTEWTGTPSTSAPRAPSRPWLVASGMRAQPRVRRAAATAWAVCRAVP